ncbi:MAG: viologen exporter family transport system permease protein [Actinomycetota bacterium]|nr:viologen exporter family transport system permease protein [Actinomycetota bacterium]
MTTLRVAWEFEKAAFRGQLAYRLNFVVLTLMGVAYQGSGFAFIYVVLHKFHTIGAWSFSDLAFLYSMRLLAHAAWLVPFNQVDFLDNTIREGKFDRFLVRPMNPLVQLMTNKFSINAIGDLVTASALFAFAASIAHVDFSPVHVLYLVLAVVGGGLAEGAFILAISSLGFRFLQTWAAVYLVDNIYLMFGSYPMRIFGATTTWILTWIMPVAFVAYIPSAVLLGRTGGLHVTSTVAYGAPVVGVLFFFAAYRIWVSQVKHYQSSGS